MTNKLAHFRESDGWNQDGDLTKFISIAAYYKTAHNKLPLAKVRGDQHQSNDTRIAKLYYIKTPTPKA